MESKKLEELENRDLEIHDTRTLILENNMLRMGKLRKRKIKEVEHRIHGKVPI